MFLFVGLYVLLGLSLSAPPIQATSVPRAGSAAVVQDEIPPTQGAIRVTIVTSPVITDPEANVIWLYPLDDTSIKVESEDNNKLVLLVPLTPERSFTVVWSAKEHGKPKNSWRGVIKAGKGPQPPPDPPGPTPPGPTPPVPTTSPFDQPGFRVMFLYRDMDGRRYSGDQLQALLSQDFRDYLDRVCVQEANLNGWRGYRIYKVGVDASGETDVWKKVAAKPITVPNDSPWMYAGNGTVGYSGPMPRTLAEIKAVLKAAGASE